MVRVDEFLRSTPEDDWLVYALAAGDANAESRAVPIGTLRGVDPAFVRLPGASGDNASTPASAATDIAGDIDVRVRCRIPLTDTGVAYQALAAKWDGAVTGRSWEIRLEPDGTLRWSWGDSSNTLLSLATASGAIADGFDGWVRVAFDVDNAGSHTASFYTSTDGLTWSLISAPSSGGVSSIAITTSVVEVGADFNGLASFVTGDVYIAHVYDGIDGTLAAEFWPDRDAALGDTTVVSSSTTETWTLGGNTSIVQPRDVYNVIDFGAAGDGVTDDSTAVQAAVDACEAVGGGTVLFPAAKRFLIDSTVTVDESKVQLLGYGATVIAGPTLDGDDNPAILVQGSDASVGTLSSSASQGDTALTVTISGVTPSPGDWLIISGTTQFSNRAEYTHGQWVRVLSVSGSTINLEGRCETSYVSGATVRVATLVADVTVEGLEFEVDSTSTNEPVALVAEFTEDFFARKVTVVGNDVGKRGIDLRRSIRPKAVACFVKGVAHSERGGNAAIGYGVGSRGNLGCRILFCDGERNRHSFEIGAVTSSAWPIDRDCVVAFARASYDWSAGVSTHGGADRTTFTNFETDTCGGGAFVRSPNCTLRDGIVRGLHNLNDPTGSDESVDHAYRFEEDVVTGPGSLRGIKVLDCAHLGESASGFNNRTIYAGGPIIGTFTISALESEAASDQPLTFNSISSDGILKILGGTIDMGNVGGVADPCIDFDGAIDGYVEIKGVAVANLRNMFVQCSGGGTGRLRVNDNVHVSVSGTGTAAQSDTIINLDGTNTYAYIECVANDVAVWADSGSDVVAAGTSTITTEATFGNRHNSGLDASYP